MVKTEMASAVERKTVGLKRTHSEGRDDRIWATEANEFSRLESEDYGQVPYQKLQCRQSNYYLLAYLNLLDDDIIQDFLWVDGCAKLADRYLLAMVYVYFRRASLSLKEFDRFNFFTALYLANDIEEDEEDEKYEIFPWAIGEDWMSQFPKFLLSRDALWRRMGFRAVVSRRTCEEVIAIAPYHPVWFRERHAYHAGAVRPYLKPPSPCYGRQSPMYCPHCTQARPSAPNAHNQLFVKRDLLDDIDGLLEQGLPLIESREE